MTRLLCASLLLSGIGSLAFAQAPPIGDPARPVPPAGLGPNEPIDPAPDAVPADPADDPLREPIERQPQPQPVAPPPADSEIVPPAPGDRGERLPPPPARDMAYDRREAGPMVTIDELVRNPIRVYDARALVLTCCCSPAEDVLATLSQRFPTDARVAYLRYFTLARSGRQEEALAALQQAVSLETRYPIGDYDRFMEPIQGPDRFYLERVRRAVAEVASMDRLTIPSDAELLPPTGAERDRDSGPVDEGLDEPALEESPRPLPETQEVDPESEAIDDAAEEAQDAAEEAASDPSA